MTKPNTDILLVESLFNCSVEEESIPAVTATSIIPLSGDASSRRYYRVLTDAESYVACLGDPQREKNAKSSFLEVQKILFENNVKVPTVFDAKLKKGYVLQEDLGNITLLNKLSSLENMADELATYKSVIDELIKVHRINPKNCDAAKLSFDLEKLMSEVEFTVDYFIKNLLGYKISKKQREAITEGYEHICKKIVSEKTVFTHRDYHSRNIMIRDGKPTLIDFQDARMGIPQYDLASLIDDCYYNIAQSNKDSLKEYYFESFEPVKEWQKSFNKFKELYDYVKMQRTFKALGSFSYIYHYRKDGSYMKYVGYGFEKLRRTLIAFPELKDLRITLSQIYYER